MRSGGTAGPSGRSTSVGPGTTTTRSASSGGGHDPGARGLACTIAGGPVVNVEAERYRIAPEDVKSLIFAGRPAPVTCKRVRRRDGDITGEVTIEGRAALNPAGRAVVIQTRASCWIVPLVSFRRVARGEAASALLFPLVSERTGLRAGV